MSDELEGYITLARAAELAGYRNGYGNLRRAAATGKLETRQLGRMRLTRREWLDAYLATLHEGNYRRGEPRTREP